MGGCVAFFIIVALFRKRWLDSGCTCSQLQDCCIKAKQAKWSVFLKLFKRSVYWWKNVWYISSSDLPHMSETWRSFYCKMSKYCLCSLQSQRPCKNQLPKPVKQVWKCDSHNDRERCKWIKLICLGILGLILFLACLYPTYFLRLF